MQTAAAPAYPAELIAVLVAVTGDEPRVLTIQAGRALPSGPFELATARCNRACAPGSSSRPTIRWAMSSSSTPSPTATARGASRPGVSISYLGLTARSAGVGRPTRLAELVRYFPWEDRRAGPPPVLTDLADGCAPGSAPPRPAARRERGSAPRSSSAGWRRLERRAGAAALRAALGGRTGARSPAAAQDLAPGAADGARPPPHPGHRHRPAARQDQISPGRLRADAADFTLLQLQRTVEALAGRTLHKQNFRRLVEQQELVEQTGEVSPETGGRPAKLFRFRREVLAERAVAGTKLPLSRA